MLLYECSIYAVRIVEKKAQPAASAAGSSAAAE
jgi:Sec-independent protein secretion pathway component TatC